MKTKTTILVGASYLTPEKRLAFAIATVNADTGKLYAAKPCVLDEHDPNTEMPVAFTLSREEAQTLMDELWRNGCRPSDQGSPGQLQALRDHPQDMRAIAFHKTRTTKP